jgi:parvulin-like peptidyl-prolyl isomerase
MHPGWTREQAQQAWQAQLALARAAAAQPDSLDPGALDDARRRGLVRAAVEAYLATQPAPTPDPAAVAQRAQQLAAERLPRPAGLQVSHIVVVVPREAPEAQREALYAEARRVLDELATKLSDRPTALELGDVAEQAAASVPKPLLVSSNAHLRFMRPGQPKRNDDALPAGWVPVVEEFAQAAERHAQPSTLGARSEPVRTPFGWHILVVERILEPEVTDTASLTIRATRLVEADLRQQQLTAWISSLIKPITTAVYQKTLEDPQ